tara:strand:- start:125 stop:880 length:756 start_codon:yes stop_codon:yes gene_type:complete
MINFLRIRLSELLKKFINLVSHVLSNKKESELIKNCKSFEFNRTSEHTIWDTYRIVKKVFLKKVEGDLVECGVETGHSLVLFQKIIELFNLNNIKIYGYDTFEGMPRPGNNDNDKEGKPLINQYEKRKINENVSGWNNVGLNIVKSNFYENTKPNKNLVLIKGKVEDTLQLENNIPKKICILKIDTCLYESTRKILEVLSPKVQKNGIIIIDNYFNYTGIKKAADEYCKKKGFLIKQFFLLGGADRAVIIV